MRLWPEYVPDPARETRLTPAVWEPGTVITEQVEHKYVTWPELHQLVVEHGLCLFTPDLTDTARFPHLSEMRGSLGVTIHESGEWCKASILHKRRRYWIVSVSQWGWTDCNREFLAFILMVYRHCGYCKPTPPALGKRLILETWRTNWELHARYGCEDWPALPPRSIEPVKHRHALPPKAARMEIKDNLHGGRVQTFSDPLPGYVKLDMDNALVSHYMRHPTGTACRHYGEHEPCGSTWFCECVVTVRDRLPLGPFPVRLPFLQWPIMPGRYHTWLWREQAEDARQAGCTVSVRRGWFWRWFTNDNETWARLMIQLRDTAPTEEVRKSVKRIASAAISCMGIGDVSYEYVPQSSYDPATDTRLYDSRGPLNQVLRSTRTSSHPTPVHWYAYTWMQVARTLYRMALPHAQVNQLVALHTDALWIKSEVARPVGWKLEEVLAR